MKRKSTTQNVFVCSLFVLLGLLTYSSNVSLGSVSHLTQTIPSLTYIGERISQWQLPLWWDGVGLGVHFAANPAHAAFYPFTWGAAWIDSVVWSEVLIVFHFCMALLGCARLISLKPKTTWLPMVLGGVPGLIIFWWGCPSSVFWACAWLPWIACSLKTNSTIKSSLSLVLTILAGGALMFPSVLLITLIFRNRNRSGFASLLMPGLSFGLAGIAWFPSIATSLLWANSQNILKYSIVFSLLLLVCNALSQFAAQKRSSLATWFLSACAIFLLGCVIYDTHFISRETIAKRPNILPSDITIPKPRIARPSIPTQNATVDHQLAIPNSATRFGVDYVRGNDLGLSPELLALWQSSSTLTERLLDLFGVEWIVVPTSVAIPAGFPVLSSYREWSTVENTHRRPRAFFTDDIEYVANWDDAIKELFPATPTRNQPIGLAHIRLIGASKNNRLEHSPLTPCSVTRHRPEHVSLECNVDTNGYAVLLDSDANGWNARVNGNDTEIQRVDILARAVPLTAGQHHVSFHYSLPFWHLGLGITLSSLAILILLGFSQRKQSH